MLVAQRKIHPVVAALLANLVLREPLKVSLLKASILRVSLDVRCLHRSHFASCLTCAAAVSVLIATVSTHLTVYLP